MINGKFEKYERVDLPIVNADRWLRSEAIRIFLNTRAAARLAEKSIREENRRIRRSTRGKWN